MKIFIAGHRGMVGSALVREAQLRGGYEILTAGREELDLLNQAECRAWLEDQKPDQIIIAAAKVGGIHANATYPAEFIYENRNQLKQPVKLIFQPGEELEKLKD